MCVKSIYIVSSDWFLYCVVMTDDISTNLEVSQDKVHPVMLQLSKDDSERFRNTEPGPWAQQPWNMFLIYMLKETQIELYFQRSTHSLLWTEKDDVLLQNKASILNCFSDRPLGK